MMSDGIHDNLDPESLGYEPSELGCPWKEWTDGDKKEVEKVKSDFSSRKTEEILATVKNPGPYDFTRVLIEYVIELTAPKRQYMINSQNPEPEVTKEFPGKMDHASILAFVVGDLIEKKEPNTRDSKKKEKQGKKPTFITFWKEKKDRNKSINPIDENSFQTKMNELLPNIPTVVVSSWDYSNSSKVNSKRPPDSLIITFNEEFAGRTISTFPNIGTKEFPKRLQDPITNFFNTVLTPGRHTFVLTTAGGYGQYYMTAASVAATEFIQYMEKNQIKILDTQKAARVILKAINHSHKGIIEASVNNIVETGVMLLGGVALRLPTLDDENRSSWALVCANIGDNRLFYWNHNHNKLTLMTNSESNVGIDPGRIGSIPDLRNLNIHIQFCEDNEKDVVILMSSTTFYNFDPENLGVPFKEIPSFQKWKKYSRVPVRVREDEIISIIEKKLQNIKNPTPIIFIEEIIHTVRAVTKPKRTFLTSNSNDEQAKGYNKLPGKMGHATCIALRIGDFIPSLNILSIADRGPLSISNESVQRVERGKFLQKSTFNKFPISHDHTKIPEKINED